MAARYVRIGQHPDYRDEIRGTLAEILASTANPGTYAAPEDVTGTFLEMGSDGLWHGHLGSLTSAQASALQASGALASVASGTGASVDGVACEWLPDVSAILRKDRRNLDKICGFGNSIIANNGKTGPLLGVSHSAPSSRGFITQACQFSNGRYYLAQNLGIGGNNSNALLARKRTAVNADCGVVVFMEFTNDANDGVTFESRRQNYETIINEICDSGKICVITTGTPPGVGSIAESRLQFFLDAIAWVNSYFRVGLIKCDTFSTIADPDTHLAISGALAPVDMIHPTSTGALLMSAPLSAILDKLCPSLDIAQTAQMDGDNCVTNPFFAGTSGAPTSWTVASAPSSWEYPLRVDHNSASQARAVIAAAGMLVIQQTISTNFVAGEWCRAFVKIKLSDVAPSQASSTSAAFLTINESAPSFATLGIGNMWNGGDTAYGNCLKDGEMIIESNVFKIPADATSLQFKLAVLGACKAQLVHAYLGVLRR